MKVFKINHIQNIQQKNLLEKKKKKNFSQTPDLKISAYNINQLIS